MMDIIKVHSKVKEGFKGQRILVLPDSIINYIKRSSLSKSLYMTHIGYFPNARHHFVKRDDGTEGAVLIYCIEGMGWYMVGNRKQKVKPNQFILIPPGASHQYGAMEHSPWSIYFIHFSGTMVNELIDNLKDNKQGYLFSVFPYDKRVELFELIYKTLEGGYSQDNLEFVNMNLWSLLSSFLFPKQFAIDSGKSFTNNIDLSIQFMKGNLDATLTLKDLAEHTNLAPTYFANVFRRKMGYSPLDYFSRLKIQKACQFLDLTDLRIKEIADKLGFKDTYYFSRVFKKVMGESPLNYKKRAKG